MPEYGWLWCFSWGSFSSCGRNGIGSRGANRASRFGGRNWVIVHLKRSRTEDLQSWHLKIFLHAYSEGGKKNSCLWTRKKLVHIIACTNIDQCTSNPWVTCNWRVFGRTFLHNSHFLNFDSRWLVEVERFFNLPNQENMNRHPASAENNTIFLPYSGFRALKRS